MIKFFKKISGPSIFTKGLLRYKQGNFEDSQKLILKAGKWMPDLKNDDFYKVTLILVKSKLGEKFESNVYKDALESIKSSPYKGTSDYLIIIEDLQNIAMDT